MKTKPLSPRLWSWIATAIAAVIAAAVRLTGLGNLKGIVFDETYYVRDAYSLWHLGYEGTWAEGSDAAFSAGDFSGLMRDPSFVVHPPLGKWLIGAGMELLGPANPAGWRIAVAVAGIACVVLTCRIAWQLFRNPLLVGAAGLFVALDGVAIVMSRTGLLDGILAFFILLAFWCTIRGLQTLGFPVAAPRPPLAEAWPTWSRSTAWWLIGAGVAAGCACAVKWSGLYVLAGLGLFVATWELARFMRAARTVPDNGPSPTVGWMLSVGKAFLAMVPTALIAYVASWAGWFTHPNAWGHTQSGPWGAVKDFAAYHAQVLEFHEGVTSEHPYASTPLSWIVQGEPTLFAWERQDGDMVRILDALGNPALWWLAVPALIAMVWAVARHRDWACGIVLLGYAVTWLPWLAFPNRTVFTFYTVVMVPFVALCLAWAVCRVAGLPIGWAFRGVPRPSLIDEDAATAVSRTASPDAVVVLRWTAAAFAVLLVVAAAAYFMPLWTAIEVPSGVWGSRTWLPSWK